MREREREIDKKEIRERGREREKKRKRERERERERKSQREVRITLQKVYKSIWREIIQIMLSCLAYCHLLSYVRMVVI
jgi:hypothetical protein